MATYYTRSGEPVHTEFALPENSHGEVVQYVGYGKRRLYTARRLAELDARAYKRRHKKTPTMSERGLTFAKEEFAQFVGDHLALIGNIEAFHHRDEQLETYWQALNVGCVLSRTECFDAQRRIGRLRQAAIKHLFPS